MQRKMRQVIRSDSFSWKGKRRGGWSASCDAMPSGDPSEDPKADMDITNDYEPVDYAINDSLIDMAECADQAPGAQGSCSCQRSLASASRKTRKTAKKKTAMSRLQKQAGYRRQRPTARWICAPRNKTKKRKGGAL